MIVAAIFGLLSAAAGPFWKNRDVSRPRLIRRCQSFERSGSGELFIQGTREDACRPESRGRIDDLG